MCLKRLFKRTPRPLKGKETEPAPAPQERRWLSKQLFKRFGWLSNPSRGGLNMPKHQPCPECGRRSKRKDKTIAGADYWCHNCSGGFFVRRNTIKPNEASIKPNHE